MPLFNFKKQFVPKILSGEKRHTIRAKRAYPAKPGDICHNYCGLRTKRAFLIGRFECSMVEDIAILRSYVVMVDDYPLSDDEAQQLSVHDGFDDFDAMMRFWEGRLPFFGDITHWKYPGKDMFDAMPRS